MTQQISKVEIKVTISLMVACILCIVGTIIVGFWKGFDAELGAAMTVCSVAFLGLRSMAKRSGWM